MAAALFRSDGSKHNGTGPVAQAESPRVAALDYQNGSPGIAMPPFDYLADDEI